jgi:hypothetical protein
MADTAPKVPLLASLRGSVSTEAISLCEYCEIAVLLLVARNNNRVERGLPETLSGGHDFREK